MGDLSLYYEKNKLNHDIDSIIGKLLEVVCVVKDLSFVSSCSLNTKTNKLKLFFPLHVCSSLRMFNSGSTNLVNSKKFR